MRYMNTISGAKIFPLSPELSFYDINDIAVGLSRMPRFGGQLPFNLSGAEHSLRVMHLLGPDFKTHRKQALLHDAVEAYMGDLSRPFKEGVPQYEKMELAHQAEVFEHFGCHTTMHPEVVRADNIALHFEAYHVFANLRNTDDYPEWILPISTTRHEAESRGGTLLQMLYLSPIAACARFTTAWEAVQ